MKRKILIGTHGKFGCELVKSAELIIGNISDVEAFSLESHMSGEEYKELVVSSLFKDESYLVLVDLFGGTPCNTFLSLTRDFDIEILSGVNLPMLIELVTNSEFDDIELLKQHVLDVYKESGFDVKQRFQKRKEVKE